jgi:hypothetical protein
MATRDGERARTQLETRVRLLEGRLSAKKEAAVLEMRDSRKREGAPLGCCLPRRAYGSRLNGQNLVG